MTTPENTPMPAEGQPTPPPAPMPMDGSAPQAPVAPQMPAMPQPQAPTAPQMYDYSQQAPQPGAPVPAMAMPGAAPQAAQPAGPSFSEQMSNAMSGAQKSPFMQVLKHIWKGETGEALDLGDKSANFWIPVLSVVAGFGALVYTFFLGRLAGQSGSLIFGGSSFSSFAERYTFYMGFGPGTFFKVLFALLILFAAGLALRATGLMLAAKLRQKEYSFVRALNLLAVAYLPSLLLLVTIFLLSLLPGTAMIRFTVLILTVVLLPMTLLTELLIYVGFNRHNGFAKSVLVPHVALSTAVFVAILIVVRVLIAIFG
ncbi:MAG: hypothetical protein Q4D73_01770 [Actinomycetaceae bacterium]|nr:hypothetical protein [Actinomycetaceae bacterium]